MSPTLKSTGSVSLWDKFRGGRCWSTDVSQILTRSGETLGCRSPTQNKKAVLSQRWLRDARYISRSWAVAEIYDRLRRYGHLKFVRTGNSAIRSAVPEKTTLEPNMKWIGSPVAEIRPFAYVEGIWNPHFGGRGGRRGSAMTPLERTISYALHCDRCAICDHSAAICDRMSPTLKSTGGGWLLA